MTNHKEVPTDELDRLVHNSAVFKQLPDNVLRIVDNHVAECHPLKKGYLGYSQRVTLMLNHLAALLREEITPDDLTIAPQD